MIAGIAARALLTSDMIDTVVTRTDGVPLFAEELTRLILEGDGRPAAREIPVTLQGSLTARLDRLGPTREVAQVAAVLGREFSYELLHAVSPTPEAELQSALERLAEAELIYTRGLPPTATYQFKHALIQDAAYEGLLRSKRRELHHLVARTISERFSALAEAQPQIVARHWTEAGEAEPAIAAWKAAGDAAYARRAFKEAEGSYQQAHAMLNTLPASPQRDARELELYSAFVQVLQLTRGYSAPETVEAAARACALAEKVGNLAQLFLQEVRTWSAIFVTGDYPSAAALADHILGLAQRENRETKRLLFAHTAQVQARFYRGDLAGVEEHFAQLTDFIETVGFKQAPGNIVITIGATSLAAWISGRADSARERIARAIAFAQDSRNPYDLAFALLFESYLYRFQREPRRAETAAAHVLALSEEHSFSWGQDLARGVMGWARAQLGRASEGVSLIRQALAGMVAARARVGITDVFTRLAEAQALEGATVEALNTIERALQANPDELIFRPNTLSCRGALRLALGRTELAESDFRAAIATAQEMNAKAWELRAAMRLARILLARRDCAAARHLLAPLYDWFTEGLGTADLQDARSLLAELDA
jgi:tetratricopeptide (TPR) repeat protein